MPSRRMLSVVQAGVEPAVTKVRAPRAAWSLAALPICVPCRAYLSAPPDGQLLALAVLPGMLPSALDGIWTPGTTAQRWSLLRDKQASTPGCSTRAGSRSSGSGGGRTGHRCVAVVASLVLSQGGLPVAYRAMVPTTTAARRCPSRAALPRWRIWAKVAPDGLEPSVSWVWTRRLCR